MLVNCMRVFNSDETVFSWFRTPKSTCSLNHLKTLPRMISKEWRKTSLERTRILLGGGSKVGQEAWDNPVTILKGAESQEYR